MRVPLGDLFAECPYCGSLDFLEDGAQSSELACARCGGFASRQVILERLAQQAGELGALTLERMKAERFSRNRKKT
ncbi:MAG TPA: hypothetical protein VFC18_12730 [Burkholderiales bacterium]|nr:hypothetical protein [Burkholderiales bacterium]